jgi:hypothetical protein
LKQDIINIDSSCVGMDKIFELEFFVMRVCI